MLAKRVIPCLDVKDGRVVKGVRFVDLRDAGDPVEAALAYDAQGADELVFLDITASHEAREIMLDVARRTAEGIYMPLTVGGGIRSIDDVRRLLRAGADKVSLNTAALERPALVREAAERFGSQCIVVAIDARREGRGTRQRWGVYTHGGRRRPSSTSASTPSRRPRPISGRAASRCGASHEGRGAHVRRAGPDPRRGPGGGHGRAPDGGLDGPAGGGEDARERRDPLLVALARRPVAQGRDLRPHPARPGRLRRLRRGRAARAGPPGGRRVSHGAAYLLLHDPP